MEFREDPELVALRDAVTAIAADFGHDYYVRTAREGGDAGELWKELASAGFVGVTVPAEFGGGGAGMVEHMVITEAVAAAGCPLPRLVIASICAPVIARYGSAELKEEWLGRLASGEVSMSFALTEPDAGSNSHRVTTTALRDGEHYRLRGQKYYISGFDQSEAVLVVARTSTDGDRSKLSLFVVDSDAAGLTSRPIPVEILAPERQFHLYLDDVLVPADRLVGEEGDGLRQVFAGLNPERISAAALCNGIGQYAMAKACDYARERAVWGTPIGAHQGLAHPLAEAKIALELARLGTWRAAWQYDSGEDAGSASNMAKYAASEAALTALDQAIQTHGGNGFASEFGLADMWGITRIWRTAPVSREMVLNFVAQHDLGLPRSY